MIALLLVWVIFQTAPTSSNDIFALISDASGPALLAVIVFGAWREWWVPGTTHRRMVNERDQLLRLLLRNTHVTERTVKSAEQFIETSTGQEEINA